MRNLSLSSSEITSFSGANISATAIDLDQNVLYAVSERQNHDADVEVEIWKVGLNRNNVGNQEAEPSVLTMFSTTGTSYFSSQIASFRALPETNRLSLIMRGGDIAVLSLNDEDSVICKVEVEGTVEPGIMGASWCPDDSLLALVTAEEKLILMTSTFDVLSEAYLHTSDFGEDAPINVGWGSKQTQFHGSVGKAAAQNPSPSAQSSSVGSSPDDDILPRISWRGDGAFFVVSSLLPAHSNPTTSVKKMQRRRVLRVYDRQASLQSTSEPVAGLEHPLAWRPSGNLIAGTQRFGFEGGGAGREGRHDIVFFEKNGLRHGEFGLREVADRDKEGGGSGRPPEDQQRKWGYKVREMCWSSDSNVLGVWIERDEGDVVQLWTTRNYHWYLKQENFAPPSSSSKEPGRFTSVNWHPETSLHIILTTSTKVIQRTYAWETFASRSKAPNDSGSVAVLDGSSILLTPFRTQNIPPPMSSYQLSIPSSDTLTSADKRVPVHASFSHTEDILAVLWESGYVEIWDLHTRIELGRGKVMEPTLTWKGNIGRVPSSRQVAVTAGAIEGPLARITVLGSDHGGVDIVTVVELEKDSSVKVHEIKMLHRNGCLVASDETIVWQAPDGQIFEVAFLDKQASPVASFPEFCFTSLCTAAPSASGTESFTRTILYVGLSTSGRLYLASNSKNAPLLATNVNSFCMASGFLIFSTTAHEAHFALLTTLSSISTELGKVDDNVTLPEWEKRRVERGSRIVTAVPSTMSLVLQMPRGNLETINPRPLVMEVVKADLDAGNYRKAFVACRKHRIDLNVIVDHDRAAFMSRLASFVEQVDDVDHINLFLTSLGRGTQPPRVIADLCDAIRLELESKDLTRFVNSILTAYVVKTPPDHESGLALLLRLRESEPHLVEEALKYIIFLVDANSLFDTALGMYDFSLVLMIAQHAQKDPREYLPFLRELRALSKFYQRFRIDDYLKRHVKALQNLSLAGPDRFEEAMLYVERHQIYDEALSIWQHTDSFKSVLDVYGGWLFERREFKQAALVFVEAEKTSKAIVAFEKALDWQALFDLALHERMSGEDVISMGYRVAEDLSSKKRYPEAARVLLDYSKDVRQAIIALVQGHNFSEARRITTLLGSSELVPEIIYPAAFESRFQFAEDINDMREQLRKQVHRLQELRVKKVEEPDAFFGTEDTTLHNVDVMTDVSMPATAFTRYTVAPTSASRTSKRSSRSKRKIERKVGSGSKGTIYEEEYLLKSVVKLVTRYNVTQGEVGGLLPHLLHFTPEHREEGMALQADLCQFEVELKTAVEEIWRKPAEADDDAGVKDLAARIMEKERQTNPIERVEKPGLNDAHWQIELYHSVRH